MVKCKVFKTDWNDPKLHSAVRAFNSFCLDNPDIEVIKIDTVTIGQYTGDVNIYLYYKKPEKVSHNSSNICRGVNVGDLVYYVYEDEEVIAEVLSIEPYLPRVNISFYADGAKCLSQVKFNELTHVRESCWVRNFKQGDQVTYRTNLKEYNATILRTYNDTCIIKYGDGNIVETRYCYIDKE